VQCKLDYYYFNLKLDDFFSLFTKCKRNNQASRREGNLCNVCVCVCVCMFFKTIMYT